MRTLLLICLVAGGCDDDTDIAGMNGGMDLSGSADLLAGEDLGPDMTNTCVNNPQCCTSACQATSVAGFAPPTWSGVLDGTACNLWSGGVILSTQCMKTGCLYLSDGNGTSYTVCYDLSSGAVRTVQTGDAQACTCGPPGVPPDDTNCTTTASPCLLDGGGTD